MKRITGTGSPGDGVQQVMKPRRELTRPVTRSPIHMRVRKPIALTAHQPTLASNAANAPKQKHNSRQPTPTLSAAHLSGTRIRNGRSLQKYLVELTDQAAKPDPDLQVAEPEVDRTC